MEGKLTGRRSKKGVDLSEHKVTVSLPLKKDYYYEYLHWHFDSPGGPIYGSMSKPLGKLFYSTVHISSKPVKEVGEYPFRVDVIIPQRNDIHIPDGFYYYPTHVIDQINNLIDFYFDTDFRQYCVTAAELGIQRKHVYSTFLKTRGIKSDRDFYDRLKKRDYRRRQRMMQLLDESGRQLE